MEYRRLGGSGVKVSEISLGSWLTYGGSVAESQATACIHRAYDLGINFFDTANVYMRGAAEEIVGNALKGFERDSYFLATKVYFPMGDGPNDRGLSRKHIMEQCERSLGRLGVDYVDLYQCHRPDPETPLEETLRALDDAVRAGKVHYVGLSNYTGWQVQKVVDLADFRGVARPVTLQPQYNLLVREIEWEIVPACESTGLGLLPWSPLGGGWLTGKYTRDERPTGATRLGENPDRGVEAYDRRSTVQRTWDVIDAVESVATARGVSMAQVALAWLVDRPTVSSVILGARTLEQLEDNLGAAGWELSEEQVARLDRASAIEDVYPYRFIREKQRA